MCVICYRSTGGYDRGLAAVRSYIEQVDDQGLFDFVEVGDVLAAES